MLEINVQALPSIWQFYCGFHWSCFAVVQTLIEPNYVRDKLLELRLSENFRNDSTNCIRHVCKYQLELRNTTPPSLLFLVPCSTNRKIVCLECQPQLHNLPMLRLVIPKPCTSLFFKLPRKPFVLWIHFLQCLMNE